MSMKIGSDAIGKKTEVFQASVAK